MPAWDTWQRKGVNQFRMLHLLLPRFLQITQAELPEVVAGLDAAGALRLNPMTSAPGEITGGFRPGDDTFELITARRPVVEAAVAAAAAATPGVTVRRGTPVRGLLTGTPVTPGVPHVIGVVTEDGEEVLADLVIDTAGRRSALPQLLATAGARPVVEELDDSRLRLLRAALPLAGRSATAAAFGPLLQHYESVSILTLPADNGDLGRRPRDQRQGRRPPLPCATSTRGCGRCARLPAHRALDRRRAARREVAVMAKIEDRHREFVVDGSPVATGVARRRRRVGLHQPVARPGRIDRAVHAVALRDLPRQRRAAAIRSRSATAWHDATLATVEPLFRDTLGFDRHRLAEIEAQIRGRAVRDRRHRLDPRPRLEAGAAAGSGPVPRRHARRQRAGAGSVVSERARRGAEGHRHRRAAARSRPRPDPPRLLATIGA